MKKKLEILKRASIPDVGTIDVANSSFVVADSKNKAMSGVVEHIGMRVGIIIDILFV